MPVRENEKLEEALMLSSLANLSSTFKTTKILATSFNLQHSCSSGFNKPIHNGEFSKRHETYTHTDMDTRFCKTY